MGITKKEHYTELTGVDSYGEYAIQIQNDCSQLRIESEDNGDVFIDIDRFDLKQIRELINMVLGE